MEEEKKPRKRKLKTKPVLTYSSDNTGVVTFREFSSTANIKIDDKSPNTKTDGKH